jgi:hypothetical protein
MYLSAREFWGVVHGMALGALFLLAYGGGLAGLYSLRPDWVTPAGVRERLMRLKLGAWGMTIAAWLTVITGTWIVYPWYRAKPSADADLHFFPRAYLLAEPHRAGWHTFGMEWKEHVAWLTPILATAVLYVIYVYGEELAKDTRMRTVLMVFFTLAFVAAAAAGLFGAWSWISRVTKAWRSAAAMKMTKGLPMNCATDILSSVPAARLAS